jgi:hypothetical protein
VTDEMVSGGRQLGGQRGLVNYARAIDGVDCGVLLTPASGAAPGCRCAQGPVDRCRRGVRAAGGGHVGAAAAPWRRRCRARIEAALVRRWPRRGRSERAPGDDR